jgi:pyrophosphate--fructose-6-phosphate 1-phosphotransferase
VKALIKDIESTKKYWHIVKLMGRSTGHIAKAVGQIAKPDFVLLGEDVRDKKMSYADIITQLHSYVSLYKELEKIRKIMG